MSKQLTFKKATTSDLDTIVSMYRKSFKKYIKNTTMKTPIPIKNPKL